MTDRPVLHMSLSRRARDVAAALIAGLWPGRDLDDVANRISAQTPRRQAAIIGGTLGLLFLLALFAAQFGVVGLALYFLAVVIVVA